MRLAPVLLSLGLALGQLAAQAPSGVPSVRSTERSATKVAEGIYVIRHPDAPNGFPQGNTTVVIGSRSVLVVDSDYMPSSAREDIAQIKQWTDKPVRYLVNTHWHFDHTFGNGAYAAAFPGLDIIAHVETATQMVGWNAAWRKGFVERNAALKQRVEAGVDAAGKPAGDSARAAAKRQLETRERIWSEFEHYQITDPTLRFDRDFQIDLGNRTVWIKYLGRGNTTGDAVVYVPDAKLIATGDLLVHPVPYLAGGHPAELAAGLETIGRMDVSTIVPGHGEIQRDKAFLRSVAEFIRIVVAQVDKDFFTYGTSWGNVAKIKESVTAAIDLPGWRQRFTKGDPDNASFFDNFTYPGLIEAAYAVAWGR
ncbi:MAG: MBL fold metallo-hydrolase [Gemmatimonadales bacterium]|nr:MBL fold metallo-hydrolase [Gemmatimonadales bacterium]